MATRGAIKGITIEIGGDATKLQKALGDIDKSLNTNKANLKDINKLLKLDPGNTELLAQKQKNLKEAIDGTKDRLEELKKVSKDSVSADEWDAVQREIIETEQNLKSLTDEYKEFGSVTGQKIQAAGASISEFGNKVTGVGTKLAPVSAAVAGLGAASLKAFKDVDVGVDTLVKKTGATGDALDAMTKSMEAIATTIPTDFETAANAVGEVNTRFGVTGDQLETLSTQFVKFAALNETDVTSAVDSAQKALSAFGLSAEDAEKYLDVLTKAAQDTGVSVDTLMQGAVQNGTAFQEMGLNIETATVYMGYLEKSGANSETVMNGLRKALKASTKEGKPLTQALDELQTTIENGTESTDGLTAAYDLFGKSGDQIYAAVKNGTLDFRNLANAADGAAGTVSDAFDATVDPMDQFQTTLNSLKILGAEIAKEILPYVQQALEKVKEIITGLKEKWDGLDDGTKKMIITIAGIVAALAPVLIIGGKMITGAGAIVGVVGKVVGVISTLGTAISGGGGLVAALGGLGTAIAPFLIGGAIVAGVVAATVLIVKNWDKIKDAAKALGKFLGDVWKGIKDGVSKAWEGVKTTTVNAWNNLKTSVTNGINNARTAISNGMTNIRTNMTNAWNNVRTATSNAWNTIRTAASNGVNTVRTAISNGMNNARTVMSNAWNNIRTATSNAWQNIKSAVSNGANSIRSTLSSWQSNLSSTLSNGWNQIKTGASNAWSAISNGAANAARGIQSSVGTIFTNIQDGMSKTLGNIGGIGRSAMNALKNAIQSVHITLPKIKMPHISVKWNNIGGIVKIPTFSVQWYKKAYDNPMMFTKPTVLQTSAGLKGFGDGNGSEVVLGMDKLKQLVGAAGDTTINIYSQPGMNVNQLADAVQNRLVQLQKQKAAAYA